MSVFVDSKQAVINYINAKNGSTLFTVDNLTMSPPAPVAGTWREGMTAHNTFMKLTAAPGATFKGRATITYDRLRLSDFSHFKPTRSLPVYQPVSTLDLLPSVLYYFALKLGPQDIVDEPVTLDANGAGTVTLNVKDTSPLWLSGNSLTFDVVRGGADISKYLTTTALNGLNYPVADPATQTSALLYVYPLDATAYRDQLLNIPEGALSDANAQVLSDALKAIDTGPSKAAWNTDSTSKTWSLQGATVVHSGLNSMAYPTNQSFKYVLCLDLRADVTAPSGRFYLHYNDPNDPNSAT